MDDFKVYKGLCVEDYKEKFNIIYDYLIGKYLHHQTPKELYLKVFSNQRIDTPPKIKWIGTSGEFQMFFQFLNAYGIINLNSKEEMVSSKVRKGYFFVNKQGNRFQELSRREVEFSITLRDYYTQRSRKYLYLKDMENVIKDVADPRGEI